MKTTFFAAVLLLFPFGPGGSAQQPTARQHSLSLEVVPASRVGGIRAQSHENKTSVSAYDRNANMTTMSSQSTADAVDKTSLQVSVRNFAAQPDGAQVECYFSGWPLQRHTSPPPPPPHEFIFDHPVQDLTLPANLTTPLTVDSAEAHLATTRSAKSLRPVKRPRRAA